MDEFNPELHVKIAADSLAELRRCDVFRLLSQLDADERSFMAQWITASRWDLRDEVASCLEDIANGENTA